MLLLLHSAFMLSVVKLLLKGEVGVCALYSHGNSLLIMEKHGKINFDELNSCKTILGKKDRFY